MAPRGRDLIRRGQFDDRIRFGNGPALGELARGRQVFGIALGAPASTQAASVSISWLVQGAVVRELAVVRIGEPRRHFAREHGALDGLGPGTSLLVGEQGERRGLAGRWQSWQRAWRIGSDVLRERGLREETPPAE